MAHLEAFASELIIYIYIYIYIYNNFSLKGYVDVLSLYFRNNELKGNHYCPLI